MPKISWNDINDSDSSLSSDHDEPQEKPKSKKQLSIKSENKLKNACDKLSLAKLEVHQKEEVWLYVLNSFYEQADKVHTILENCKTLKKVNKMKNTGWSVQTDYDNARILILEGLNQDDIFIKFIYSNKNDGKQSQHEEKPLKLQKKVTYVQKANNSPQIIRTFSTNEQLPQKQEKIVSMKQLKQEKPKVRWMEKEKPQTIKTDKVSDLHETQKNQSSIPMSPRSPKSFTNLKEIKTPKKYVQKEKRKNSDNIESKSEKKELKKEETSKVEDTKIDEEKTVQEPMIKESPTEETMQIQYPKPCQDSKQEEKKEVYSDESSDVEVEQKKKKNKKKKKTKNGVKNDQRDLNNPFSYFAQ